MSCTNAALNEYNKIDLFSFAIYITICIKIMPLATTIIGPSEVPVRDPVSESVPCIVLEPVQGPVVELVVEPVPALLRTFA
jgi:hypothetical protein